MHTKLSRVCDAIIEAGWLAAVVVTPLFFNTHSYRVFEPDKLHLLRSIALVMAVAWLALLLDNASSDARTGAATSAQPGGLPARLWRQVRATPFVLPALILVLSYLLSTALSVVPRISFFGSYVRLQGTLTFLSYVAIFGMVLTRLRRRSQVQRLLFAIVLTSVPISIYAIMQRVELDPLPWGGDVRERVAANLGNAIFVAAYLIMAVFVTLERLVDSAASLLSAEGGAPADIARAAAYLFAVMIQLAAILLTLSRGPWIGLAAGAVVFVMIGLLLLARWAAGRSRLPAVLGWLASHVRAVWLGLVGLLAAALIVLGLLNVPGGPLKGMCQQRYVARLCTLASRTEGTNAVRVLIWQGVVDLMLRPHAAIEWPDGTADPVNALRPLVGYGPESMWVAYNRFYPPELGYYESRNASPDRSHNETFDALVRGGLLQFGAELFLFGSIFYYALRWLGLVRGRRRQLLFAGLLAGGAILVVGVLALIDGGLRLAGIGLPAGMGLGVIAYVLLDLLLTPPAAAALQAGGGQGGGRRSLLILALLAAIVAHFFEVHFGIAIAATLTHFWVLVAVLAAVGMGWVRWDQAEAEPAAVVGATGGPWGELAAPARKGQAQQRSGKGAPGRRMAGQGGAGKRVRSEARQPEASGARASRDDAHKGPGYEGHGGPGYDAHKGLGYEGRRGAGYDAHKGPGYGPGTAPGSWLAFLPYAFVAALVTLVLTWNYIPQVLPTGTASALAAFWDAFTTRADPAAHQVVRGPMLLVLMGFTWLIGGMAAVAEGGRRRWAPAVAIYAGLALATWLIFGLVQGSRVTVQGQRGLDVYHFMAGHIVVFDLFLLLGVLALAGALWLADERPRPAQWLGGATPAWAAIPVFGLIAEAAGDEPVKRFFRRAAPLFYGPLAAVLAVLVIASTNIHSVQADTYYKQGLGYESAGQWEGSVILYREALKLQPKEDYYYLFLGRALLQLAQTGTAGSAILPATLDNVATEDLPALVDTGVRSGTKEDLLRASHAALVAAQRLNPLNTDHTANLARLHRAWAFANSAASVSTAGNSRLRQLVRTQPETVGLDHLVQSESYYRMATQLSPQNVGLWNELATIQLVQDRLADAQATLERSLAIDPRYAQTYLVLGDVLDMRGDAQGALTAFRKAAELSPKDVTTLSAVGVAGAGLGDVEGSVEAFRKIIEIESKALDGAEQQLAQLNALAARSGGYGELLATAASRRQTLESEIASHQDQLFLSYRNVALVLRDAGRREEALQAARQALAFAGESDRPAIESLIADLTAAGGSNP